MVKENKMISFFTKEYIESMNYLKELTGFGKVDKIDFKKLSDQFHCKCFLTIDRENTYHIIIENGLILSVKKTKKSFRSDWIGIGYFGKRWPIFHRVKSKNRKDLRDFVNNFI